MHNVFTTASYAMRATAVTLVVGCAGCSSGEPLSAPLTPPNSPTPTLISAVELIPSSVALSPGASQQFSAVTHMSDGSTQSAPVTYVAAGGTMSSGIYTAGNIAGTFSVIATLSGGTLSDTSIVTVPPSAPSAPPPSPPSSPPPSGSYANEPAGMVAGVLNPLNENIPLSPGKDSFGWTSFYGSNDVVTDPTRGTVVRTLFQAGAAGGSAPRAFVGRNGFRAAIQAATGNSSAIARRQYMSFYIYLSPNWTNSTNTGTKFLFLRSTANGSDQNHYVSLSQSANNGLDLQLGLQFADGSAQNFPVSRTFPRGQWHRVEMYFEVNAPGQNNGVARIWVNGTQVMNYTNVGYYKSGQTADWGLHWVNPTYGGGFAPVPADQFFLLDDWYTSLGT